MKLEAFKRLDVLLRQRLLKPLKHINSVYVWALFTLGVIFYASSLINALLFSNEALGREALEKGQRVIYHVTSGDIDGTPRHTKKEEDIIAKPIIGEGGAVVSETFDGKEGLAPAPLDTITEQTEKGLIPTAGKDGTLPWKYYARPFTPKEGRPIVAIVITNLGLSKPMTEEAMKLPHDITLSFSPYASDARNWARRARGEGYESMIDLPLEPSNFPISDPGPYGLISSLEPAELSSRLHWILSRYPGFVGTLASLDEKMTGNIGAMRNLLTELTARGVLFIYRKSEQNAELANFIKTQNLLALAADAVIDEEITPAAITQKLDALAEIAKTQGYAVGLARSYPPTQRALELWVEELDKKGVDVAPISAVAKKAFP